MRQPVMEMQRLSSNRSSGMGLQGSMRASGSRREGSQFGGSQGSDPSALRGISKLQASRLDLASLAEMCQNPQEIMEVVESQLEKQRSKMEKAKMIDIKNIKQVVVQESIAFVKKSLLSVEEQMTKEHQNLIQQFIDFKDETYKRMDQLDCYPI